MPASWDNRDSRSWTTEPPVQEPGAHGVLTVFMAFACTEDTIALTEAELARALPEAYRARLKRRDGGAVTDPQGNEWELHPIRDTTDRRRLQRTANHIVRETTVAKGWRGSSDSTQTT